MTNQFANESSDESRVLVTGGAGFIGSHLVEALLGQGHHVTVIDDVSTGSRENVSHLTSHPRFSLVIGSIMDGETMDRLVSECDSIFHLAAAVGVRLIVKDPVRVLETNILGTHSLLKAASQYQKKILIVSTSEIYGKNNQVPFKEDDDRLLGPTTRARWNYSTSKAVDEFLALAYFRQTDLPVVIVRLFNTVGPRQSGQYGMVVARFVEQAMAGNPITVYGDGQQSRCFCDVEDVVSAMTGLMQCRDATGQIFNVGSTDEITILELANRVLTAVGQLQPPRNGSEGDKESIVFVPYEQAYEEGFEDMRRRVPYIWKIQSTIGWEPKVSLDETLRRIVAFNLSRADAKSRLAGRSG